MMSSRSRSWAIPYGVNHEGVLQAIPAMQQVLAWQHFLSVELQAGFFCGSETLTAALGTAESEVVATAAAGVAAAGVAAAGVAAAGVAAAGVAGAGDAAAAEGVFEAAEVVSAAKMVPDNSSKEMKTQTLRMQPPGD